MNCVNWLCCDMRANCGCDYLDYDNCGCDYLDYITFMVLSSPRVMMLFGVLSIGSLYDELWESVSSGFEFCVMDLVSYETSC